MKAYVVEKEALSHNIELLQKMANGVPIWAVLKGNGYGIGVLPLARHLAEAGIDHFCVTEVREAELLRENGFEDASILMLRSTGDPAELNRLMDLRVILTIGSWETACAINAIAAERADVVEAHLKIDTGMGPLRLPAGRIWTTSSASTASRRISRSAAFTRTSTAPSAAKSSRIRNSRPSRRRSRPSARPASRPERCTAAIRLPFCAFRRCTATAYGSARPFLAACPSTQSCAPSAMPRRMWRSCASCRRGTRQGYGAMWTAREDTPGRHCPHRLVQRLPRALRRRHHTLPRLPEPHSARPARDLFPRPAARGGQRA